MQAGLQAYFGLIVFEAIVGAGSIDALVGGIVPVIVISTASARAEGSERVRVVVGGAVAGSHTQSSLWVAEQVICN